MDGRMEKELFFLPEKRTPFGPDEVPEAVEMSEWKNLDPDGLPKTDLHVHLEGTMEPEMFFRFAARNRLDLPWKSPEELRGACHFRDLGGFLKIYFKACEVLRTGRDFYELTGRIWNGPRRMEWSIRRCFSDRRLFWMPGCRWRR